METLHRQISFILYKLYRPILSQNLYEINVQNMKQSVCMPFVAYSHLHYIK